MPGGRRPYIACEECKDAVEFMTLKGTGKCVECFGSGVNVHINHDDPQCRNCKGTGLCPACNGKGQLPNSHYRPRGF